MMGVAVYGYNPMEAGILGVQGQPQLHSKLEASLKEVLRIS